MPNKLIIVGGGQAAAQAIHVLVQKGYTGTITLVGDESDPPYQRPPLSKKYLAGELDRSRLYFRPRTFYAQHDVALELGIRATGLDAQAKRLTLADGRELGYDTLLLATGSRVRMMDVPGAALRNIHYLRALGDADAINALMQPDRRLVIVGAGYIGLEVAAIARARGLDVTVLEAADRVMARVVCPEVADFYRQAHTAAGVEIVCDTAVSAFAGNGRVSAVVAANGRSFPCDLAIVGIGVGPETTLAEQAGLQCDDGIRVDEFTRTSASDIYAAGDCTNHPNSIVGGRVRLESVQNAVEQAKIAAFNMLGDAQAYAQVPWFWSDQYDLKLQIAGLARQYDHVVIRGEPATRHFAAYYLRAGQILAVDAINSPKDFLIGKKLIAARAHPDPALLADSTVDLAELAQSAD
jgi:3-phenylpropionate/trans-cinnamate dioxygenase ferredoxin reductase subunit